jgi:hypothetical protein
MIAKVKVGKTFGGTVRYLFEGHKEKLADKRPQLLDYNGIRPDKEGMIKDFNRHRRLNPELGNAVGHISLSYHPDDSAKAGNSAMTEHARQFMNRMGIDPDNTQWVLIRHRDQAHEHCHLVYNRVDFDGKTISDAKNYKRSHEATHAIAKQYGLTVAAEKKKDLGLTHQKHLPGHDQARYKIFEVLSKEVTQATTIEELKKSLKAHNIETMVQKNGQGMSFKMGNYAFKASEVDRQYTGRKIHAQIEKNQKTALQRQIEQQRAKEQEELQRQAEQRKQDELKEKEKLDKEAEQQRQAELKQQQAEQKAQKEAKEFVLNAINQIAKKVHSMDEFKNQLIQQGIKYIRLMRDNVQVAMRFDYNQYQFKDHELAPKLTLQALSDRLEKNRPQLPQLSELEEKWKPKYDQLVKQNEQNQVYNQGLLELAKTLREAPNLDTATKLLQQTKGIIHEQLSKQITAYNNWQRDQHRREQDIKELTPIANQWFGEKEKELAKLKLEFIRNPNSTAIQDKDYTWWLLRQDYGKQAPKFGLYVDNALAPIKTLPTLNEYAQREEKWEKSIHKTSEKKITQSVKRNRGLSM